MSGFDTWDDVLEAVERGEVIYYKAPLDYRPVMVHVVLRGRKIRVEPSGLDADPFVADEKHLERFRRMTS